MSYRRTTLVLTPDLADEGTVRLIAEEVARRLGEVITVTNDDGDEVYRVAPPHGNELIVLSNTLN